VLDEMLECQLYAEAAVLRRVLTATKDPDTDGDLESVMVRAGMSAGGVYKELQGIAEGLKAGPDRLPERIERMKREREELERNYQNVLGSRVPEVAERLLREPETIGDVRFYYGKFDTSDPDPPLRVGDIVTSKSPEPYVYVGASGVPGGDSLSFMVKVSPDLTKVLSAVDLVREIGRKVKGGGGGSRTKAQGGGKDPSKLPEAIDAVKRAIEASLNG
jgi:alanyl-tRNA synthetase